MGKRWIAMMCLAACGGAYDHALPLVRLDAERDLRCPGESTTVEAKIGGRYKATGCGRSRTYRASCMGIQCVVKPEDAGAIPWAGAPEPARPEP